MNKILSISLLAVVVSIFVVAKIECSKFTTEELAELRRFYYDDEDAYDENHTSSEDSGHKNSHKNRHDSPKTPEPRSSSKSKKSTTEQPLEEENEEPRFGPGALFNGARKFLNTSRKTINEAAQRILPPLPKLRMIRRAKSKAKRDEYETTDTAEEERDEDIEDSSDDNAERKKNNRGVIFQNPLKNFSNDASRIAADTGGKILSILNKFTPPPALGLPTPLPNLEDFGG